MIHLFPTFTHTRECMVSTALRIASYFYKSAKVGIMTGVCCCQKDLDSFRSFCTALKQALDAPIAANVTQDPEAQTLKASVHLTIKQEARELQNNMLRDIGRISLYLTDFLHTDYSLQDSRKSESFYALPSHILYLRPLSVPLTITFILLLQQTVFGPEVNSPSNASQLFHLFSFMKFFNILR